MDRARNSCQCRSRPDPYYRRCFLSGSLSRSRDRCAASQAGGHGIAAPMKAGAARDTQRGTIEGYAEQIQSLLDQAWPGQIYREQILKGRNRSYHFGELSRRASVEVQHTLLGVELKVGRRRFLCPDLATA